MASSKALRTSEFTVSRLFWRQFACAVFISLSPRVAGAVSSKDQETAASVCAKVEAISSQQAGPHAQHRFLRLRTD